MASLGNKLALKEETANNDGQSETLKRKDGRVAKPAKPKKVPIADVNLSAEQKRKREELSKRLAEGREAKQKELRKRISVGIDLGTTYSGAAIALFADKDKGDADVIVKWGGGEDSTYEKIPTRIAYAFENPGIITDGIDRYGHEVTSKMVSCSWFKLGLDGSRQGDFDDPLLVSASGQRLMHLPVGKTYQDMVADFLRYKYGHILIYIGTLVGNATLSSTPIDFHVTLPATWSPAAREATRQAALSAGIGSRQRDSMALMDEPEAAAICAIHTNISSFKGNSVIKQGACVTVADLGGGTCDFISYKIVKMSPLQLEEACVGEGAKCGGTTIDRNLHELLGKRFGAAFEDLPIRLKGSASRFMDAFERAKRDFNPDLKDQDFSLPLKMKQLEEDDKSVYGYDFMDDTIQITSQEMGKMFDETLFKTFEMVRRQIIGIKRAKMPKLSAIILCGGLGSSSYIRRKFIEFSKSELNGDTEIIAPRRSWSAIARGAAIGGLGKPPVLFRRSRDFIGIPVHVKFDPRSHIEADVYHHEITGEKRAKGQMEWMIQRGDQIKPTTKATIECYTIVARSERKQIVKFTQALYCCTTDVKPQRLSDENVRKVGEIIIDVSKAFQEKKKTSTSPGPVEVLVTIEVSRHNDKGWLQVAAKDEKGKLMGDTKIEYVSDPAWKGKLEAVG